MLRKVEESFLDILDRILDKGIVIDAWMRFSLVGLDLMTIEARFVVASIETHLEYAPALRNFETQSPPRRKLAVVPPAGPPRIA